jgi:hypothetical protein
MFASMRDRWDGDGGVSDSSGGSTGGGVVKRMMMGSSLKDRIISSSRFDSSVTSLISGEERIREKAVGDTGGRERVDGVIGDGE